MKTRILHTKIWDDDFFVNLTEQQQNLFIYLMTNGDIGLTGIYELSDRKIRFYRNISQNDLDKAKMLFEGAGKIAFKDGWVYVLNAQKYGGYYSSKLNEPILKELKAIPVKVLEHFRDYAFKYSVSIPYQYTTDTTINHKPEIINDKSETINQGGYKKFLAAKEELTRLKGVH